MIVQAVRDYRVGMSRHAHVCAPLHTKQKGAHSPSWFDIACKETWQAQRMAVQTGQLVHACEIVRKQNKIQVSWSNLETRNFGTSDTRESSPIRLYAEDPAVHATSMMLRQSMHTHRMPVAQTVWVIFECPFLTSGCSSSCSCCSCGCWFVCKEFCSASGLQS